MLFNKVSYRRGVIEGVIIYTFGRLGALISPAFFPGWLFVAAPLLFLLCMYVLPPVWAAKRMISTRRERLSKRFWWLGPRLAVCCVVIDVVLSLCVGLAVGPFGIQLGPALSRLQSSSTGIYHLSLSDYLGYELKMAVTLFAFFMMAVICTRLAGSKFLRFTMPAGGDRVTL
ncbi:MAG TPA: hypothetical protein VL461_03880 [Dictyobacter sp.]|jgi:hypothetical protein|nr:hypothetical protein [Dictyobacter sp.]